MPSEVQASEIAVPPKVANRTKPIIIAMIVLICVGGILAFTVPLGFLGWLDEQQKLADASQAELENKAHQVMTWDTLPAGLQMGAPTFSLSKTNRGSVLFEQVRGGGTSYYFEKKDASKLGAVKKRMMEQAGIGDHFTVKESGTLPVAGKTLEYVRGISQRDTGTVYNELHGYAMVDDKTLVEVAIGTSEARPLDMDELKALLGSIKSFTP
jgi:hypothetical protein